MVCGSHQEQTKRPICLLDRQSDLVCCSDLLTDSGGHILSAALGRRDRKVLEDTDFTAGLGLSETQLFHFFYRLTVGCGHGRSSWVCAHSIINTFVDMPIVLPPVVLGISLLAFFGSPIGNWIKEVLQHYGISLVSSVGIVMCQYIVSVSYCIRAMKASFDNVDQRLEHVSLTLGCSQEQTFLRVTLPLTRNGLIAGGIMAWARAIGVFGPLMVFVGTGSRVQVMPTKMWLELNVGNIENALVVSLVTMAIASIALVIVHYMAPGRKWS